MDEYVPCYSCEERPALQHGRCAACEAENRPHWWFYDLPEWGLSSVLCAMCDHPVAVVPIKHGVHPLRDITERLYHHACFT